MFAANVLSEPQTWLSDRFDSQYTDREANRFQNVEWLFDVTRVPILKGSQAYLDCRPLKIFDTQTPFWGTLVAKHADDSLRALNYFHSQSMALDYLKIW